MRTATRVFETKPLLSTATEVVGASCRVGWLGELHVESSSTREIKRERERERESERAKRTRVFSSRCQELRLTSLGGKRSTMKVSSTPSRNYLCIRSVAGA